MKGVSVENLSKVFGGVKAVDNVSFDVESGKLLTLLGPSGCGKTTTLRMIAGLVKPDSGRVIIRNKDVTGLPPWKRNCGFVFQSYALFPHMSVRENIAYGLKIRKMAKKEIEQRINHFAEMLGIDQLLSRKPRELSGGQQQRVALARALVIEPDVLLMDEPLANLDAKLRDRLRFELRELQRNTAVTTVYVTHDQEEAFVLSDHILVMHLGKIQQLGTPEEVFYSPSNVFVASFIGRNNIFVGKVIEKNGAYVRVQCAQYVLHGRSAHPVSVGDDVAVIIGTRNVQVPASSNNEAGFIVGVVRSVVFLGEMYDVMLVTPIGDMRVELLPKDVQHLSLVPGVELRLTVTEAIIIPHKEEP
ncbi:MAG: ABC transporter ATP-binding protein [Candidatus Methanomethyliaceae archaeon]